MYIWETGIFPIGISPLETNQGISHASSIANWFKTNT